MKNTVPAVLAVLCLWGIGAVTRGRIQAPQPSLQHRVTVTLKLIQVFVTDAKDKPAVDLEKADFVVYDNGVLQTVTDFEKHVLVAPAATRAEAAAAPAPPAARPAAPLLNRKFIFFIDYGRNDLEGLAKARKAATEFLDTKVQKDDEVALFSFSTIGGLTLHEYLTLDHGKVRAAIMKMRDIPGISEPGMSSVSIDHEATGMELLSADIFGRHGGHAGAGARNLFAEVAELAKAIRNIPGQKNIILFSRGFGDGVVRPGAPDNSFLQMMARQLASANAPVFTVNTTTGMGKIQAGVMPEASLDYLSRTTGGKYLGGVDYPSRIAADIQDATANYYVLGFYVPETWDGKFHDVKVEVRKPGFKVYAQKGYFNPIPFNKLSPVEKHLRLLDLALGEKASSKRSLDLPMTAVPFAGAKEVDTLLLSEISVAKVREAVGDHVEFICLIWDQNKTIVDGKRVEIDWKDFRMDHVFQYAAVALAPGRYDCRAVIRNLDDGRAAVGACSVDVPEPPAAGPALFPPLFLVRGTEALYLNVATQAKDEAGAGISISRIFPFPAKDYVPLVGDLEPGSTSLFAVLRCAGCAERGGEWELSARLVTEGGEVSSDFGLNLIVSSSQEGIDCHLLEFELPELAPGRYRLEIMAEDPATGLTLRTANWFSVRAPG
jgi:VWFA-related protein